MKKEKKKNINNVGNHVEVEAYVFLQWPPSWFAGHIRLGKVGLSTAHLLPLGTEATLTLFLGQTPQKKYTPIRP